MLRATRTRLPSTPRPAGDGAAGRSRRLSGRAACQGPNWRAMPWRSSVGVGLARVRGSRGRGRGIGVVNEGDDTLTESCEGAINFMVIETRDGSLQERPVDGVVEVRLGRMAREAEDLGCVCHRHFEFVFNRMDGSADYVDVPTSLA